MLLTERQTDRQTDTHTHTQSERKKTLAGFNKDGGAHRVFIITQKYPVSPMAWTIRGVLEDIVDT